MADWLPAVALAAAVADAAEATDETDEADATDEATAAAAAARASRARLAVGWSSGRYLRAPNTYTQQVKKHAGDKL